MPPQPSTIRPGGRSRSSVMAGAAIMATLAVSTAAAQANDPGLDVAIAAMGPDSYYCRFDVAVTNRGAATVDRLGFRIVPYIDGAEVGDTWGDSISALAAGQTAQVSLAVANIPGICERVDAYDIVVTACRIDGANRPWRACREAMTLATDRLPVQP